MAIHTDRNFIIDIETLAASEKSVIASFAICYFDMENDKDVTFQDLIERSLYIKFDIKDQTLNYKRVHDKHTLNFWKNQPHEAREFSIIPKKDDIKSDVGLLLLKKYLEKYNYDIKKSFIWTRGIAYDIPKIESFIHDVTDNKVKNKYNKDILNLSDILDNKDAIDGRYLLNFWNVRDTRTYFDVLLGGDRGYYNGVEKPNEFIPHHALHDNAFEALKMIHLYHN